MDEPIGCGVEERGWGLMRGRGLPFLCAVSNDLWGGRGGGVKGEEEPIGCRFEERGWGLRGGRGKERSWANRMRGERNGAGLVR